MIAKTDLIESMSAPENLLAAWRAVRGNIPRFRRARSAGPDGVTLNDFERDLPAHLSALRHALLNGRYDPQPPGVFSISKPGGGARQIAVLNVSDRVAQRSAQQVLEPLIEPAFLPCSFGFRPGRSLHDAVYCVRRLRASDYPWVVDGDIAACFDSLDHQLLLKKVEHFVHDPRMLDLLHKWLNIGILKGEIAQTRPDWLQQSAQKLAGGLQRGLGWLATNSAPDPWAIDRSAPVLLDFGGSQWDPPLSPLTAPFAPQGYVSDALPYREPDGYPLHEPSAQQRHLRQLATSGLMLGLDWARNALIKNAPTALAAIKPAAGSLLLHQGLLIGGGAAGVAVGAVAVAAAVLHSQQTQAGQVGVLQGSAISPLLANLYLHSFDHALTRSGFRLVRFADDWVILCPDQENAEKAYNQAVVALSRLKLKVNSAKTKILSPVDPLEWLGETIQGRR